MSGAVIIAAISALPGTLAGIAAILHARQTRRGMEPVKKIVEEAHPELVSHPNP